jgi:hypothetical protein
MSICAHCTRREFLHGGLAAGFVLTRNSWLAARAADSPPARPRGKARIRVIFTGTPVPSDRNWGADGEQVERSRARLTRAADELGNIEVPPKSFHGCRTQIVTAVRDAARMALNWSSALDTGDAMTLLHRVVFYGDHLDTANHLARLLGLRVFEEG